MKLNLKYLLFSAAVMAILMVANPLCSFAQESELVSRPYLEKSSSNGEVSEENFDGSSDEDEASKNGFVAKDSIVSSAAANNRSNHNAPHRNQRSKNASDQAKQSESQKAEKNDEKDSILSFNFIYYIFKKFKWSDIAD